MVPCTLIEQIVICWIVVILLTFADDCGKKEAHGRHRLGQLASMGQEGHGRGLEVP
jgi:hypothetical protein